MRERLEKSVDIQYYKGQIILLSCVAGLISLCMLLICLALQTLHFALVILVLLLIWAPFVIHYSLKIREILQNSEGYRIVEGVLSEVHTDIARTFYFIARLENGICVETNSVFMVGGLLAPRVDDYSNKRVEIAYCRESGSAVVLNLL